jgi:hypothetical protein
MFSYHIVPVPKKAMVDILKQVGTADWDRERLNMSDNTLASLSAHALRTRLEMLSGTGWVQDVGIHDMASFPFVVR